MCTNCHTQGSAGKSSVKTKKYGGSRKTSKKEVNFFGMSSRIPMPDNAYIYAKCCIACQEPAAGELGTNPSTTIPHATHKINALHCSRFRSPILGK